MNRLIAAAVERLAGCLPDGRGLRILEIGAGTGSTTESIVRQISDQRVHYVFTDVAASFLPAARQRFATYNNMQFRVLDIERDPLVQGFKPASFDIVVAANVIHATQDMHVALSNIHTLLAPGGTLTVLEGTRPVRWLDLTFGLTNGWWRFTDTHLRPDYPLLSGDSWQRLVGRNGFRRNARRRATTKHRGTARTRELRDCLATQSGCRRPAETISLDLRHGELQPTIQPIGSSWLTNWVLATTWRCS